MIRAHPSESGKVTAAGQLSSAFVSAFLLMLANPTIVVSFLAVFAAIDLAAGHAGFHEAGWLGAGVFLGSAAWWLVYKGAAVWFGAKLKETGLHQINLGAGLLICGFGVWQLVEMVIHSSHFKALLHSL
jgi:threonine/homoserine/homoserine lactone efflux protein